MADFYRKFAFVSSVLAGFSFTFYGTLLMAAREHRAGTWAAFLAVAASVAFLPVTLGDDIHRCSRRQPAERVQHIKCGSGSATGAAQAKKTESVAVIRKHEQNRTSYGNCMATEFSYIVWRRPPEP